MNINYPNPAECLEGEDLGNNWVVTRRITPHIEATGGNFSIGYKVKNDKIKKTAYLKAFDFFSAFQAPDFARELQALVTAFNFERDVLNKCKNHHMRRVLTPIYDGIHTIHSLPSPLKQVHYLIFDLAENDIRIYKSFLKQLDLAWCLRSLHHSATGIMELHSKGIVHQDIKPSNVLVLSKYDTKLSDLGRSYNEGTFSYHDLFPVPGDNTYAPIELLYPNYSLDNIEKRKAIDVYSLGSLVYFHFCGISTTQALINNLLSTNSPTKGTDYYMDLPIIQHAFRKIIQELEQKVIKYTNKHVEELIIITSELCEPDPLKRGDTKYKMYKYGSQYSVERYVSRFNLLAREVEAGII